MMNIEVRIDDKPANDKDAEDLIQFVREHCKTVKAKIRHFTLAYAEKIAKEANR